VPLVLLANTIPIPQAPFVILAVLGNTHLRALVAAQVVPEEPTIQYPDLHLVPLVLPVPMPLEEPVLVLLVLLAPIQLRGPPAVLLVLRDIILWLVLQDAQLVPQAVIPQFLDLGLVQVVLPEPILVLVLLQVVILVLRELILEQELLHVPLVLRELILEQELLHVLLVLSALIQQLVLQHVRIVLQAHMLPQQELPRVPLALQELTPLLVQALVLLVLRVPTLLQDQARVLHVQWAHTLQLVQDLAPVVPQAHMQAPQDRPHALLVPQVLSLLQEHLHVQVVVLVTMQLPPLRPLVQLVQ
jgi:hypothetical protein